MFNFFSLQLLCFSYIFNVQLDLPPSMTNFFCVPYFTFTHMSACYNIDESCFIIHKQNSRK